MKMKRLSFLHRITALVLPCLMLTGCINFKNSSTNISTSSTKMEKQWLRDYYGDYFDIGAATLPYYINNETYEDLLPHYSTLTCENDMKWAKLESQKGQFTYQGAKTIVDYAKSHNKKVRGHTLLWHKSLPNWVKEEATTKKKALSLIDQHVKDVISYFGNDVYCYDVVNEALHNSITQVNLTNNDIYRTGEGEISGSGTMDWYEMCDIDYIKQAFRSANEAKTLYNLPDLQLFYNDYSLNNPYKRKAACQLVRMLQNDNIRIDGIGMQAHYRLKNYTDNKEGFLQDFEDSIKEFTSLGIDVQITELDICVYPNSSEPSQFDSLPKEVEEEQAEMFGEIFRICREYSLPWKSGAGIVSNVTTWGIADDHNAHNNQYHQEYPLVFHRDHSKKKAFAEIVGFKQE